MSRVANEQTLGVEEFRRIAELAYTESGLQLVAEKTSMIQSRLRHRLKALGLNDFSTYTDLVCSNEGKEERRHMISALTTNVSHFFRENHHFEIFQTALMETYIPRLKSGGQMRVWSAGGSHGQEAVSIALTLLESFPLAPETDCKILATDIDPNVVAFAAAGIYPERFIGGVPERLREKYFEASVLNGEKAFKVKPLVRSLITFRELNLLGAWPMKLRMDLIFCRNVVIYFDLQTQNKLWPRFHAQLHPDGYLFLGHSERVADPDVVGFCSSGPTAYRPKTAN
jgi:chemotaxis protein methyltransferase CheR